MIKAHIVVKEDHSIKGIAPVELPVGEYDIGVSVTLIGQIDLASGLKSSKWGSPSQKYDRREMYKDTQTKWDILYGH